jgi:hypothetical protein
MSEIVQPEQSDVGAIPRHQLSAVVSAQALGAPDRRQPQGFTSAQR